MHVSIAVVVVFFNIFTWFTILDGTIASSQDLILNSHLSSYKFSFKVFMRSRC